MKGNYQEEQPLMKFAGGDAGAFYQVQQYTAFLPAVDAIELPGAMQAANTEKTFEIYNGLL